MFVSGALGSLIFFGGAIALFFRFLQWHNTIYGFTNKRLLKHSGIFSKQFYETKLKRVQDTTITIEWVKSFFNCGDIRLETSGSLMKTELIHGSFLSEATFIKGFRKKAGDKDLAGSQVMLYSL